MQFGIAFSFNYPRKDEEAARPGKNAEAARRRSQCSAGVALQHAADTHTHAIYRSISIYISRYGYLYTHIKPVN